VFLDATNDMSIAQDELLGPVVSIIRGRGEDEALKVANTTSYGLSSAVPKKGGSHDNGRCQAGTGLN
jgi:acyl-CoA reductase-like NAD-dependent aldehyde dehydrogenase